MSNQIKNAIEVLKNTTFVSFYQTDAELENAKSLAIMALTKQLLDKSCESIEISMIKGE